MSTFALPTNVTLIGYSLWMNSVNHGIMWTLLSLVSFIVMFMGLKKYVTEKALPPAAFVSLLVAIIWLGAGLVDVWLVFGYFILLVLSFFGLREK